MANKPITIMDADNIASALDRIADEICASITDDSQLAIIGIRRRGDHLAARLLEMLTARGLDSIDVGTLDITLYRDDLAELGAQAKLEGTEIDFDVDGRYIILVDDVVYTGRSVRSALDALVDLGRPKAIRLAVLVDRPGRELPIQPDFAGLRLPANCEPVRVFLAESDDVDEVRTV